MTSRTRWNLDNFDGKQFHVGAEFEDADFHGIDFSLFSLKSVSFLNCHFVNCRLANQAMVNTTMVEPRFSECHLLGVNWCQLKRLEFPKFHGCKLNLSSFQSLKLKRIEVLKCSAVEVDFSDADLTGGNFSESSLAGTNFSGAILEGVDFRLSRDYIFDLRKARIKGARFSFPEVMALITALGAVVE